MARGWGPLLVALAALLASPACRGAKVILTPLPGAESHAFILTRIGQELVARGHTVLLAVAACDLPTLEKVDTRGFTRVVYNATYTKQEVRDMVRRGRQAYSNPFLSSVESFLVYYEALFAYCTTMLESEAAMQQLQAFGADLLVGDLHYPCSMGLAALRLRTPHVLVSNLPLMDPVLPGRLEPGLPNPLAYNPQTLSGLSPAMGTLGRAQNLLFWAGTKFLEHWRVLPMIRRSCARVGMDCLAPAVVHSTAAFLFNIDYALEWPRPLPLTVKAVGPLLARDPQPLPAPLQAFLEGAGPAGVVYASFGTLCTVSPAELHAVAAALSALPSHVIWQVVERDLPAGTSLAGLALGPRVLTLRWAPQQDLLGHPQVRAFLTHGGINSIYEAAYHGKPVAGLPIFGDQRENTLKAVHRGFGLLIEPAGLTADRILRPLLQLLEEDSFTAAARKVSRNLRAHVRTPAQRAADEVEYVLATGGDPFRRTPEARLPWWQRHLLDAWLVLGAGLAALALLLRALAWGAARLLRRLLPGGWRAPAPASLHPPYWAARAPTRAFNSDRGRQYAPLSGSGGKPDRGGGGLSPECCVVAPLQPIEE